MSSAILYYYPVIGFLLAHATAQGVSQQSANAAGASGPSSDSGGMSSTGMIILGTVVGVVVIVGLTSTALFFVAKKRQWEMRQTIRRSTRQVVEAIRTPLTPRFSRSQDPFRQTRSSEIDKERAMKQAQRRVDLEKGFKPAKSSNIPVAPKISDSARDGETKSKGWGSFFAFERS